MSRITVPCCCQTVAILTACHASRPAWPARRRSSLKCGRSLKTSPNGYSTASYALKTSKLISS